MLRARPHPAATAGCDRANTAPSVRVPRGIAQRPRELSRAGRPLRWILGHRPEQRLLHTRWRSPAVPDAAGGVVRTTGSPALWSGLRRRTACTRPASRTRRCRARSMSVVAVIASPRTCSGAMYSGVPIAVPIRVSACHLPPRWLASARSPGSGGIGSARRMGRAMPKSASIRRPSGCSSRLDGFTSRCTMPCSWA